MSQCGRIDATGGRCEGVRPHVNQALARVPTSSWSDALLIEACRAGDEGAWTALVNKYRPLMLSIPRRYGASAEDAADVLQSVCIELLRALPRLRDAGSVRAWIATVASHEACRWKRQQQRMRVREAVENVDDLADTSGATPAAAIDGQQLVASIQAAVGQLPQRQQLLVRMLFFHDPPLQYEAIASRLGLATGSVAYIRARCLKRLRGILSDQARPARSAVVMASTTHESQVVTLPPS
jgi:RNA polymerase sigma factor (sigma-70 family)